MGKVGRFRCYREKKPPKGFRGLFVYILVGRRGFEPLISALRGRCPGPLDERPTHQLPDRSAHERIQPDNATKHDRRL